MVVKLLDGCRGPAELILCFQKQKVCCDHKFLALHPAGTRRAPLRQHGIGHPGCLAPAAAHRRSGDAGKRSWAPRTSVAPAARQRAPAKAGGPGNDRAAFYLGVAQVRRRGQGPGSRLAVPPVGQRAALQGDGCGPALPPAQHSDCTVSCRPQVLLCVSGWGARLLWAVLLPNSCSPALLFCWQREYTARALLC